MLLSKNQTARRGEMYRLLARIFRVEADEALLTALRAEDFPAADGALGAGYARMKAYLSSCGENALEELAVDFAATFLAAGQAEVQAALPYESLYAGEKKLFMQEPWEDVCRRCAEAGLGKASSASDLMEDHLSLELEFMAHLSDTADAAAQLDFLRQHLLNWVETFANDVETYGKTVFYKAAAQITLAFLRAEEEFLTALLSGETAMAQGFSLRAERFDAVLARLKTRYRLFAPRRFPGRGAKGGDLIRYGEIHALADIEHREKSHFSPKEVFYPISQPLFDFTGDTCEAPAADDPRDILLFLRPCDLNAVQRLDTIFLHNGAPDSYYAQKREKVKFVLMECGESMENCFCVSMHANVAEDYAAAIRIDDICALMEIRDEELLPYFADEVPIDFAPKFVTENARKAHLPAIDSRETLEKVCKAEYWNQFDEKCIACGGCNAVCPTCSCFDTVDITYNEQSRDGQRRRVWSGCMLADFTRTAGGGMARKTPGANMRFKVLHKVYDFKSRFGGENMCVGCGRCIARCPQGIDYLDAVNGLTNFLAGEKEAPTHG